MRRRFLLTSLQFVRQWCRHLGLGMLGGGAIALSAAPGFAVERVAIRFGPTQASVHVSDLATFSQTGEISPRLEWYRPLLTPTVRMALQNHLSVEPAIRDRFLQDLMASRNGRPVIDLLAQVAPDLSPEILQAALTEAAQAESGVTIVSLLEAIPGEALSLDGGALLLLLSQLGLSRLEQVALSEVLDHELNKSLPMAPAHRFEPSVAGTARPEKWSVSFRDHQRDRVIPIDMYWTENSQGPLVVISHGFGADRHFLTYLAEHLASHGLTVVALEHPGSNVDALVKQEGALLPAQEFVERPRDVSFILDRLEDLNDSSFFLRERLNLENVTLIGHSLGGYTGLVLAGGQLDLATLQDFCADLDFGGSSPADWFQCVATDAQLPAESLADPRLTQLVVLNPLAGKIFGDHGLRQVRIPTLFLASTSDSIASVSDQQLHPFNQLAGPRSLIAVIGGTHLSVGDPNNINPALTQVPFMPERPEAETLRLRQYLKGVTLSFLMQQTDQAQQYQAFLRPDYAQLFSTSELPIRYSDRLPSSVTRWLSSREILTHRLTPSLKSLASLLHLELIDAQHRIADLQTEGIAQLPLMPIDLSARLPRSPVLHRMAYRRARANRESPRPARSHL